MGCSVVTRAGVVVVGEGGGDIHDYEFLMFLPYVLDYLLHAASRR